MEIAKNRYIQAQDVVDYVATPGIQEKLETKARGISLRTGQRWLKKLNWWYNQKRNGMYIDGHEQKDVVQYWDGFLKRWKGYEKRMVTFDNDGNIDATPIGFPVPQTG